MRVLVTGGAGFIGSHVVEQLVADGHDVVVVDSLDTDAHAGRPEGLDTGASWRWHDLTDTKAVLDALDGVEAVCHLAAKVGPGRGLPDTPAFVTHNCLGTASLLWALHEAGFAGRIVVGSSMAVYGEGAYHCQLHGPIRPAPRSIADLDAHLYEPRCPFCRESMSSAVLTEDDAVDPRTVYAATKLHQEHLLRAYAREHEGTTVTALRYHNVYGPRMPHDVAQAGVAGVFRSQIETGQRPGVLEDGGQRRDFIHVRDVAHATVLALTCPEAYDGPLNIATGRPVTLLEMATALCIACDTNLWPEVIGTYRVGDVRHLTASPARAYSVLGFRSEINLHDGMAEFARAPLRSGLIRV